jgi:periplasmic nitrate reductase NapD
MNISSLIVDVRPERLDGVQSALLAWPGIEIHAATPQGKLIVTVETESDGSCADAFARIAAVDGVMSVAMVYHQVEQEIPDVADPT